MSTIIETSIQSNNQPNNQPNKRMKLDHTTDDVTNQQTNQSISKNQTADQSTNQSNGQSKKKFQYERPSNEPHIPSRFLHINASTDLAVQPDGSVNVAINLTKTTKSARKAARREQRFEQAKAVRAVKRSEYKQRQKARKAINRSLGLYDNLLPHQRAKGAKQRQLVREMTENAPRVVIDLSDERLMKDEECYSLAKQLRFLYIDNNHADIPVRIVLSNMPVQVSPTNQPTIIESTALALNDAPATRVFDQLSKQQGVQNWAWDWTVGHFLRSFPQQSLCYLTAESEDLITDLDPSTVYVIGGLVDHNRLKNHCETTAKALGLRTARLPIGECMQSVVGHRSVITVNQVFGCLLLAHTYQTKLPDQPWEQRWAAALQKVLPERQGWKVKDELAQAIVNNPAIVQLTAQPIAQPAEQSNNEDADMDVEADNSDDADESMSDAEQEEGT